jgi:proline iminopeptidase
MRSSDSSPALERFKAFKATLPRTPRLTASRVKARGLEFAVWSSPPVAGALPLLCVNGGMIYSHNLLWPGLAALAHTRQVILYDQRGRGASQVPPAPAASRMEFDAGDIPALRDALGIARWDLLGHSWGGGIAMLAAARDLTGVRRLVLASAVGCTGAWIPALHPDAVARLDGPERHLLASLDPTDLLAGDPDIHAEYSRALYPAYFADRALGRMFAPPRERSVTGAAVAARMRREGYDLRSEIAAIRAATLLIHGRDDVLPASLAVETAGVIPHASVHVVADAGHMPFFEQPAEFFGTVTAFLDAPDRGA